MSDADGLGGGVLQVGSHNNGITKRAKVSKELPL
jgi:hypothetical protein